MANLNDAMRKFLEGRYFATLATLNDDGSVHMTPVWFLFENDHFYISSASMSRKVRNIEESGADVVVVNDVSCMTHLNGILKRENKRQRARHIAQVLNEASVE